MPFACMKQGDGVNPSFSRNFSERKVRDPDQSPPGSPTGDAGLSKGCCTAMNVRFMTRFTRYLCKLALGGVVCITTGCGTFHSAGDFQGRTITVRTTAYTHTEADHLQYGRSTAAGGTLSNGPVKSAGADWSRFPVGTRFRILETDTIYEIDDYGSALVGTDTIDLYKINKGKMREWGVREVEIEILSWGCYETSYTIMAPRSRFAHVNAMLKAIAPKVEAGQPTSSNDSSEDI